jgi:predicted nucleic acid-binding protein
MEKLEAYETFLEQMKVKLPGLDTFMADITTKFGPFIIDFLREQSTGNLKIVERFLNFRLQLVIDNNILFAEIKGLIKGNKEVENCFFYKLALSKSTDFYAPPFLREEILEKVEEKFEEQDRQKAKRFAEKLLETIKIKEAQWVEDWISAKRKIGHRDIDDIPYLALFFDLKGHGIMSNDKIFVEEQSDAKVWSIGEAGKMSAQFDNGMVSFFFIGQVPNIVSQISNLFNAVALAIVNFIKDITKVFIGIFNEGISFLSKLPVQIYLLFGGLFLFAYLGINEFRQSVNSGLIDMRSFILRLLKMLKIWFEKFIEFIKTVYDIMKPHVQTFGNVLLYLMLNGALIVEQIKEIENIDAPLIL